MGKNMKKRINALICTLIIFVFFSFAYLHRLNSNEVCVSIISPYNDEEIIAVSVDDELVKAKEEITKLREQYSNDDIIGKLVISGTGIDEPILQANDNSYYLNHNNYGKYQAEGSIYADYRTNIGDRKLLIFGHSSPGWTVPFNELERYYEKDFYDRHQFISIVSESGIDTYQIFSVYVETSNFNYMNLKIDDAAYNKYLKKYKYNSLYDTGVGVNDGDNIVILQTCSNHPKYSNYKKKFLLVIGKKVNKEEKDEKGINQLKR